MISKNLAQKLAQKPAKPLCCLAAAASMGLSAVPARAAYYTGEELYKVCTVAKGTTTYVENTYECIAYVTATLDTFNAMGGTGKVRACVPEDVTIAELRQQTVRYLGNNPKDRKGSAAGQVLAAMRKAWPCASGKKR